MVISFNDVEIAAKKKAEFIVSMSFNDDFDSYGKKLQYTLKKDEDFNAIDSKTESRVKPARPDSWPTYTFNGGKVKLTNTKVGAVDAAYGSEDVKIAEWNVTTSEALRWTFTIYAQGANVAKLATVNGTQKVVSAISSIEVSIAGDEYEVTAPAIAKSKTSLKKGDLVLSGTKVYVAKVNSASDDDDFKELPWVPFTFNNVDIEKSGKVTVKVDVEDNEVFENAKITFSNISSSTFSGLSYEDTRRLDATSQIAGFITLYDVTVKPAKAAFKNNLTKAVEFIKSETTSKDVLEGTYSAKNGTVKINDWTIRGADTSAKAKKVTFYLTIDGEEIDDIQFKGTEVKSPISNVEIEDGKEVKVVVTAEVEWTTTGDLGTFSIIFEWEDENGNKAGSAKANTVALKIVEKASLSISNDSAAKSTVLRKEAGAKIAEFTIKPSNGASDADFETIEFTLSGSKALEEFDEFDTTLSLGDETENLTVVETGTNYITYSATPNKPLKSAGVVVKVNTEKELTGTITLEWLVINGKDQNRTYSKKFVDGLVKITAQKDMWWTTQFTVSVDADSDITLRDLFVGTGTTANLTGVSWTITDGDTFEIKGIKDEVQLIESIKYTIDGVTPAVTILKKDYNDFFKIGESYIRVFKSN